MSEWERAIMLQRDLELPPETEREETRCPVCGELCERLYRDVTTGETFGCDVCVEVVDCV